MGPRERRRGGSAGAKPPGSGPLYGALREFCSRCERRIAVGAPQARPPERSGDHGAPRAEAWRVRGGEAPRIWTVIRRVTRILFSLRAPYSGRRATGAPAGAERGSWGPASGGVGGPRGRSPPDLDRYTARYENSVLVAS